MDRGDRRDPAAISILHAPSASANGCTLSGDTVLQQSPYPDAIYWASPTKVRYNPGSIHYEVSHLQSSVSLRVV